MSHEVIMPALGMAQETGVLVSWLKQPGDAVAQGEPLMEVETDKAVMEVEAQASGWLADVRAKAGEEVPVGAVIALIAKKKPDAAQPEQAPSPVAPVEVAHPAPVEAPVAAAPAPAAPPQAAPTPANGRV
ncbi:MAG: dihydrolipoamide acetyltransferase, partial [Rhodobacteraceae bacterium]|nr:dihydrolipoamide acetyltransferase [Paracoccaceae bacterium]